MPPLKLCYRGLGELDVGLTHSPGAILCGFIFQGGVWHAGLPWLMSLPLFLAVLPSITLSRVPDPDADEAVGKRTLSRCGPGCAAPMRSPRCSPCWQPARRSRCNRCRGSGRCSPASSTALPHALLLLWLLARQARLAPQAQRIDRLMVVALAYILWFVGVPLAHPA